MEENIYVVRSFINGREGCRPTEFSSKEAAIDFIDVLNSKPHYDLKVEYRLYETKEIYRVTN